MLVALHKFLKSFAFNELECQRNTNQNRTILRYLGISDIDVTTVIFVPILMSNGFVLDTNGYIPTC